MGTTFYSDSSGESLKAALEIRNASARRNARRNYFASFACYAIAIVTSLVATIAISVDLLPKAWLATLSAVPGTALLVASVFSFEKKSEWYWTRQRFYDAILMRLTYEKLEVATASKELRIFDAEMEKQYPKFGAMPQNMQKK